MLRVQTLAKEEADRQERKRKKEAKRQADEGENGSKPTVKKRRVQRSKR